MVPKFIYRICESREDLLNPGIWTGSDLINHVRILINDWFPIHVESRTLAKVYDLQLAKLTSRTTLALMYLSQEIVSAYANPHVLTISMTHTR